ncbi:unnamed protein product, partial [Phaeothamnion confervicola]
MSRRPVRPKGIVICVAALGMTLGGARAADKGGPTLAEPTPNDAVRAMSTDRPDKTESPFTVDAGHVQLETDLVSYTRDSEHGATTRTVDILPFNVKIGLAHDTDLQIVYGASSRARMKGAGIDTTNSGSGDVTVRLKHNLWGNDGGITALAVMPFVKLPANTLAE